MNVTNEENKLSYEQLEEKVKLLEQQVLNMKELEQSIKVGNTFLKKLFDTIPNPMFYKDINGVYTHCNDAFSKTILGIPKEEILGKTLYDLPHVIPSSLADIYCEKDKELLEEVSEQFYEAKVKCANGLMKDFHFYKSTFVVDSKILGLVGVMLDVSDYKKVLEDLDERNKKLSSLSITDYLTGLYNRRYFQEIFKKKLSLLSRHQHKFSFVIIDIDFFKAFNDSFGHHEGDIALKDIAQILRNSFNRPNDYIFRLGGEEFGILFDVDSFGDANDLIDLLRQRIEDQQIKTSNKKVSNYLTISAGLGNIKEVPLDIDETLIYDKVDKLLYESKNNGRNQVTSSDIIVK